MRSLVAWLLASLPFDPPSRRALDEALFDWTHESDEAPTFVGRLLVDARALAGIARTVAGTVAFEVTRIPVAWLAPRLLTVIAVPAALLTFAEWGHFSAPPAPTWRQALEMAVLALPPALLATLPLALFVVIARTPSHRAVPGLGVAAVTFGGVLLFATCVMPNASRRFHVIAYATDRGLDPSSADQRLPFGPGDLTPFDVAGRNDVAAVRRIAPVLFQTGFACVAAAFVILGGAVARQRAEARRWWIGLVAAIYVIGVSLVPSSWELGGHAHFVVGFFPWFVAAAALVASLALQLQVITSGPTKLFAE